mmetsp:Transcript_13809/g.26503  ORF Transcript_13809/g.26503 Transcript_13809/m.26503 type:complete len:151 (+) Transcript_13809:98-550(+)
MASSAAQSKAQALNLKLEGEARAVIDQIETQHLRRVAKAAFQCAVGCYDKAGTTGSSEVLEQCVQNCQMPHRQKQNYVQQEIQQFQQRLNQSMQECQYQAQDLMKPGYENDAKMVAKVEEKLIGCMSQTVDKYIALLKPLQARVVEQLKK